MGKSPAALPAAVLPAALADGVGNTGRLDGEKPDDAGELVSAGLPVAAMVMAAAAAGSRVRLVALPVTVRLTAVVLFAVTGMVTSAWSSRWAELESTVPSPHVDAPLPLPQPKVKDGEPAPALDCSWIEAADTVPPSAQAPTSHSAACPRPAPCCSGTTPTHKLAGVTAAAAAWNAVRTATWSETPAAAALAVDVPVDAGADVAGAGVVGAEVVGAGVVGAGVVGAEVVGAGVVGAGVVGAAVVGAGVAGAVVVGAGVVGAGVVGAAVVGAEVVGAGVVGADVLGVALADVVAEAEDLADALADAVTDFTGVQDSASPEVAAAAALLFSAATTPPDAAESNALPAIKVTARRRPRVIRVLAQSAHVCLKHRFSRLETNTKHHNELAFGER